MVQTLADSGISANQVTLAALLLSFLGGAFITWWPEAVWPLLLMPVTLFLRMALNGIDGMLAREHGMKSRLGAIHNELGDVLSDAALYLPLALLPGVNPLWIMLAVLLAIVAEMTGVIAVQIGAVRRYDGPMGKSDRAFVFGLLCLLLGLELVPPRWFDYAMNATVVLLVLTIINRARRALAESAG